jgi:hypothetical protein
MRWISGSGRCGTTSTTLYLDGLLEPSGAPVRARHETRAGEMLDALASDRADRLRHLVRGFSHDLEVTPHLFLIPREHVPHGTLVAIIRDGRETVTSGMNCGWLLPSADRPGHWSRLLPPLRGDRFARCCQLWSHAYATLQSFGAAVVRLEDLQASEDVRRGFLELLGLCPTSRPFPHRNRSKPTKARVAGEGVETLPGWPGWSPFQRDVFTEHCGVLMDVFYPGWRA